MGIGAQLWLATTRPKPNRMPKELSMKKINITMEVIIGDTHDNHRYFKHKEHTIIMEREQLLQKISNLVWDAKWINRISGWEHFAKVLSESVPGNRVNFSHETVRQWSKGCTLPDYQKMQIVYDHSVIQWTRNLARDIMQLLRPDLWKQENNE